MWGWVWSCVCLYVKPECGEVCTCVKCVNVWCLHGYLCNEKCTSPTPFHYLL